MTKADHHLWIAWIAWLREEFPARRPVRVHLVKYVNMFGQMFERDDHYLVNIANRLVYTVAVEALLHEWAHCLVWTRDKDHGKAWAQAYGEIYRAALKRDASLQ